MKCALIALLICLIAVAVTGQPNKTPANREQSANAQTSTSHSRPNNSITSYDAERPINDSPKWYAALERPDWWLVLIAAATGWAIFYQAKEMKAATDVMRGQLKAMKDQLGQMEATGKQTDDLIKHAGDSAKAALLNATVLANSERPWVLIEESVALPSGAGAIRNGHIYFRAKNYGKNPAQVTRHCCEPYFWPYGKELPAEPEYHPTELKYPQYLVPGELIDVYDYDCWSVMTDEFWDEMNKENQRLLFVGHVVYVDVITGEEHETRFCHSYTPYGTLILQGPRSYNKCT